MRKKEVKTKKTIQGKYKKGEQEKIPKRYRCKVKEPRYNERK